MIATTFDSDKKQTVQCDVQSNRAEVEIVTVTLVAEVWVELVDMARNLPLENAVCHRRFTKQHALMIRTTWSGSAISVLIREGRERAVNGMNVILGHRKGEVQVYA